MPFQSICCTIQWLPIGFQTQRDREIETSVVLLLANCTHVSLFPFLSLNLPSLLINRMGGKFPCRSLLNFKPILDRLLSISEQFQHHSMGNCHLLANLLPILSSFLNRNQMDVQVPLLPFDFQPLWSFSIQTEAKFQEFAAFGAWKSLTPFISLIKFHPNSLENRSHQVEFSLVEHYENGSKRFKPISTRTDGQLHHFDVTDWIIWVKTTFSAYESPVWWS